MCPDSEDPGDAELANRVAAGDESAFVAIFERYYDPVRAFACRMLGCIHSGEDVAQETFVRVGREIGALREAAQLRSWIFRIAANLSKDAIRRQSRARQHLEDYAWETQHQQDGHSHHLADAVRSALDALPEKQRAAVLLVYFENLSHAEAAHALGCAETTISWRLLLARQKLKNLLDP